MNKKTHEFVDRRSYPTTNIFEAVGWETEELCKKDIQDFDEPNQWTVAIKIIEETAIKKN